MSLIQLPRGLLWPYNVNGYEFPLSNGGGTLDATGEQFAMIGRLYIDGRPTAAKTLSTGTIQFRLGTTTFANAGTTVVVSVQDVATGAGPFAQPDGTPDVSKSLTGGGGGLTTAAWNTVTMDTGSKSMTHGDLIAVVWNMSARAGADSVVIVPSGDASSRPVTNIYLAGAWQTSTVNGAGVHPNVIIVFDDGTLGWIDGGMPYSKVGTEAYQDSTNPDERGMIFQVPFDCEIDGFFARLTTGASANADYTFKLYTDPTGTPALVTSSAILAEQISGVTQLVREELPVPIALTKNTDYGLTVLATGTANLTLSVATLGNTAHRAAYNGGTSLKKITRNNSSGAFTAESPAITLYAMGVRISAINDTAGLPRSRVMLGM